MEIEKIVIKIGTSTITRKNGLFNLNNMQNIAKIIANLKNSGLEVVVVSSGAVGIGAFKLGLKLPLKETALKQAAASVGQCALMNHYSEIFLEHNMLVSQILLTQNVLDGAYNEINAKNTFKELLSRKILPIVNENDTISIKELEWGDNDTLSASVANLIEADLLVIFTDLDGLYNKNPNENFDAKLIKRVSVITKEIEEAIKGKPNFFGTGGMQTKLKAAKIASFKKIPTVILNGKFPERLLKVLDGEIEGTLIDLQKKFEEV